MSDEMNAAELDFSLVIPVYNEEANLEELIRRCLAVGEASGKSFEVVLTDDGSRDRSREILEAAAREHPGKIVAVLLNRNYGQHSAVMAGLAQSRGEVVVTLDADLQNPPEEVPNLLAKMDEGFDVVGTRRVNRQDSTFRKFASKIVNHAAQRATGVKMTDYGCMLRAYRRPIVQAMLQCHERSTFIPILANGFARTTAEIPVEHAERPDGDSKYSLYKLIKLQFDMMTCMTTFPLRVLTFFGLAIAAMGFLLAMVIFVGRIAFGAAWAAQGVFTLFAILFIFVGAQFVGMGLLGEYIGRIYTDVRARPRYFVEKVIDGK